MSPTNEELNQKVSLNDPTNSSLNGVPSFARHLTLVASKTQVIPSGLEKRFPQLMTITLKGPFTGLLPPEWFVWKEMEVFDVSGTGVSGPLPPSGPRGGRLRLFM